MKMKKFLLNAVCGVIVLGSISQAQCGFICHDCEDHCEGKTFAPQAIFNILRDVKNVLGQMAPMYRSANQATAKKIISEIDLASDTLSKILYTSCTAASANVLSNANFSVPNESGFVCKHPCGKACEAVEKEGGGDPWKPDALKIQVGLLQENLTNLIGLMRTQNNCTLNNRSTTCLASLQGLQPKVAQILKNACQ